MKRERVGALKLVGGAVVKLVGGAVAKLEGGAVVKQRRARRPPTGAKRADDLGSAVVEFVTVGMLMLLPLVYLVVALARVQAASYAVDSSAREAAREISSADDVAAGLERARSAVRIGLADQGFDVRPEDVLRVQCSANPCLTPQGRVDVTITVPVVLPGVPAFVDRAIPTRVTVRGTQTAVVDRFRSAGEGAP